MKRRAPLAASPNWAPASAGEVQLDGGIATLAPASEPIDSVPPQPTVPSPPQGVPQWSAQSTNFGVRWLKNRSTSYEITDQRLIIKRGILFKTIDEIELYRIKDVRLGYSLLNQMTDIGTIILTSSDRTTAGGEFTLRDIPMARDRREGLRKLVDRARQRRGVRELDVEDAYALD
jgi:hypothetical protein